MTNRTVFDLLVIGGGINGLSTLYHACRLGCQRVGLLEQFAIGHDRGSSHSMSRITRSTYIDDGYVRLMQRVHGEEWPRLERDAGRSLIHRTPGCFFGTAGKTFEKYASAVATAGAAVDRLDPAEGRRRFPQFRFESVAGVLHDHTAGLVAAADTIDALTRLARRNDVEIMENCRVRAIDPTTDPITVETEQAVLHTERLVLTAGAWVGQLLPMVRPAVKVTRQTVGYFKLAGPASDFQVGRFPVWMFVQDGENGVHYGLPEFGREGIKAARHCTSGPADDPDRPPAEIDPAIIDRLCDFVRAQFAAPLERVAGAEHCLYTNTASEDFILDLHPDNPRIAIGSACSGHGFKFGPLSGLILTELVLHGKTSIEQFERMRPQFSLARQQAIS